MEEISKKTGISKFLMISLIVLAILIAVAGTWYYMDKKASDEKAVLQTQLDSATKSSTNTDKVADTKVPAEKVAPAPAAAKNYDIQISYNSNKTVATITSNGVKAGDINIEEGSAVRIKEQNRNSAFLLVSPDGIGGYILFGLEFPAYKLDLATNKIEKFADKAGDISSSERYVTYSKGQNPRAIILYDTTTKQEKAFPVDEKYGQFGDATFSPNEKKIAYAAAMNDLENERGDIFIIDIESGTQTKVNPVEITGHAPKINYWNDNSTLNWY